MSQGIFGLVDFTKGFEHPEALAARAAAFLGSDRPGGQLSLLRDRHYILGMRRLPSGSPHRQQHIARSNELGACALMCGEIHNADDLLKRYPPNGADGAGDIDLAIRLYRREGPGFGRLFNGLFSLAVLDERSSSVTILNDRFGMARQIYWTETGGSLCFATHLKTLLALPGVKKDIDYDALNLFLKYSYITSPWSIIKGIKKLPPGHMLFYRNGEAKVMPYWEFKRPRGDVCDLDEAITEYRALLKKAVSRRLRADGGTGILLSGGLDSSANVALAAEAGCSGLKTFSVGFEDQAFDERPFARIVADHYRAEHYEQVISGSEIDELPTLVWGLEEPYFEFGLFLTYLGLSGARKEVDTVIGGEGADQLFGTGGFAKGAPAALHYVLGRCRLLPAARAASRLLKGAYFYERDNRAFKIRLLWDRAIDLNNWYFYGYDDHELQLLHRDGSSSRVPKIFSCNGRKRPSSFADLFLETQIEQDLRHYVNENVMVKSGRMADMLDVNLRESYLDTEVTDFLVSLDFRLKRKGGLLDHCRGRVTTKLLHRKAVEDLLPEEVLRKPKQGGFVPVMLFLKDAALRNRIYGHLLRSAVIRDLFRTEYLYDLFGGYEKMQGRDIYWANFYNSKANRILFLLTFDIWHHLYMENDPLTVTIPSLSDYVTE